MGRRWDRNSGFPDDALEATRPDFRVSISRLRRIDPGDLRAQFDWAAETVYLPKRIYDAISPVAKKLHEGMDTNAVSGILMNHTPKIQRKLGWNEKQMKTASQKFEEDLNSFARKLGYEFAS